MKDLKNKNVGTKQTLSNKAWTAYVRPSIIAIVFFSITQFSLFSMQSFSLFFSLFFSVISLLYIVYNVLMIRSFELYVNDNGVWLYRGIFPWNKRVSGVKWRDLEGAGYYTGFMSWALKSYTIKISHRFTKGNEILLTHMKLGDKAVFAINSRHKSAVTT